MNFNHITLEEEQKTLFRQLAEIVKSFPRNERMAIQCLPTSTDFELIIPSKKSGYKEINEISAGDIQSLVNYRLLEYDTLSESSRPLLHITPVGFEYYEYLVNQITDISNRIESHVTSYYKFDDFEKKYPLTVMRLKTAEKLLWKSDSMEKFTQIGHLCREAAQHFAETLYINVMGKESSYPINHTVKRLSEIVALKKESESKTLMRFLDSLIVFWGELNDLIQKQEHGAENELTAPVGWEDSRRVLFQTLNLVYELDRSLSKKDG